MLFIFNELRTATAAATSDKLGEILLREGLITQDQLKKALLEQKNTGMRLGYTLVKLGYVEETEISKMLARQYRMPAVDLSRFEVDPKILKLLPPDVATKHTVLPLKREGRTLTVAIADPNNVTAIEDIKFITRCDGSRHEVMKPPIKMRAALTSRIKIMAQLNIAERRVPQDRRIKLKFGAKVIDYRVSTLPVLFGEKIVLRILDKGNLTLDLTKFGFEPKAESELLRAILNPYGMVLVTGPTGSGKTTTLYSALSRINQIDVNIMTAEDPVEYNLMGINQVLVRNDVGMTFAAALKAFLRQDPNIIMVGEIRDLETGSIAIKAALTGHLVLSTLHTNSAPETVTRLLDMGLEPFNVASALNLILAQRLLRRICSSCKEKYDVSDEELTACKVKRTTKLKELKFTQAAIDSAKERATPEAAPF